MGKYKVIQGQNIYDVALHIYGSIEGVTDLLVNNEDLSFDTDLRAGDELAYSDDYRISEEVTAYYGTHGITPASGEQHVYPKYFTLPKTIELYTSNKEIGVEFSVSGSGRIEIDWGDNSKVQVIMLSDKVEVVKHLFDSTIGGKRCISLYMQGYIKVLDISELRPIELYILKPLLVERFALNNATLTIDALPMLGDVFALTLDGLKDLDFTPLVELKNLMSLSLMQTVFRQPTIDAYLIGLVERHDNRRNCKVAMTVQPSGQYREPDKDSNNRYLLSSGMEAIWVLTHEEAWNDGGAWEFIINGTTYKYEQNH
jgi:hypothetical protein